MKNSYGFNLLELILVVIILTILAGLMFPRYQRTMERAKDHEAITALKAIDAGEKIYRVHYGDYYDCKGATSNVTKINENLGINIVEKDWSFLITVSGENVADRDGGGGFDPCAGYSASAFRKVAGPRYKRSWGISSDRPEPCCGSRSPSACPSGSGCN